MAFPKLHVRRLLLISLTPLLLAASARAAQAVLHLTDGSKVTGEIVEEGKDAVTLKVKFGTITYKRSEIASIKKTGAGGGGGPAGAAEWRDVIVLNSGDEQVGLIVAEDEKEIAFDVVMSGRSVSRTLLARTTVPKSEIASVKRLTDEQRTQARDYLQSVKDEARRDVASARALKVESKKLTEEEIRRFGFTYTKRDYTKPVMQVELEHFIIVADLEEDFLRKVAFKLAKVFDAYKAHFGVHRNRSRKVHVIIFNSGKEYSAATGLPFVHPAYYRPDIKAICAGFALAEYKTALARRVKELRDYEGRVDSAKAKVRGIIDQYKKRLRRSGGTSVRAEPIRRAIMRDIRRQEHAWQLQLKRHRDVIEDYRSRIRNVFDDHTKLMIRTTYHEGVHAFLDQFLFGEKLVKHLPRWLNEGLAQYFQNARVEGGRLILGQQNRKWLSFLRNCKREGKLVPIEKLLASGPKDFLADTAAKNESVSIHYRQSWYLVHRLGEWNRLKTEHLDAFVRELAAGRSPMSALPTLTDMSNAEFKKAWEELRFGSRIRAK